MRGASRVRPAGVASVLVLAGACSTTPQSPPAERPDAARAVASAGTEPGRAEPRHAADPGETALAAAWRDVVSTAPLAPRRLNFFHSALEVPPLATARTLPCGTAQVTVATTHARSRSEDDVDGVHDDFDGTFHEWVSLEFDRAVTPSVELGGRVVLAGWDESQDRFRVFDDDGDYVVSGEDAEQSGEATSRHMNVSQVGLRAKVGLGEPAEEDWRFALAPSVKIPIGRDLDLTHAGTLDTALTLLATVPVGDCTFHANLGGTVPWTPDCLFEPEADADVDPFVHAGVALVVPMGAAWSFATQVEANSSAFGDVEFLDENPVTWVFGFRRTAGDSSMEFAAGTGLDHDAAYQLMLHFSVTFRF